MPAKARGTKQSANSHNSAVQQHPRQKGWNNKNGTRPKCDKRPFEGARSDSVIQQILATRQHLFSCCRRAASLWIVLLVICSNYALAAEQDLKTDDEFKRTFYAGAGLGVAKLEPNTNKIDGWDVNDAVDNGGQINLGLDLSRQLSFELHSADLGSAGLSPNGRINYHIDGISALIYAGGNRNRYKRTGLTAYGRGGFGLLSNSPVGDVPFRKIDANHWLWGAGVEFMHSNGFGARAEVISFSKDAQYGQLGMIYRFGQDRYKTIKEKTSVKKTPSDSTNNTSKPAAFPPPPPPPPPPAPPPSTEQQQLATRVTVADHCSGLRGVMDGIRFDTGSAHLTSTAQLVLDDVAVTLLKCPQVPVIISAHTDSQGSQRTNQILSQRRAWAVINYLRSIDIDLYRLIPRAFGEAKPIDNNNTAEGRRNNRRVELIAR